jgi:hypothetical protein
LHVHKHDSLAGLRDPHIRTSAFGSTSGMSGRAVAALLMPEDDFFRVTFDR